MAYLTLVNVHTAEGDSVLQERGVALAKNQFYDFIASSENPTTLFNELQFEDSSSITLDVKTDSLTLDHRVYLILTKPGADFTDGVAVDGPYDHIISSKSDISHDLRKDSRVTGFLDLCLREPIVVEGQSKILEGRHYRAADKQYPTEQEISEILIAGKKLGRFVDNFDPTLIYAPARGAHPVVKTALWEAQSTPRVYFPVTSSFVIRGRKNNRVEIASLKEKRPTDLQRVLYMEEVVSGGMFRGHSREIRQVLENQLSDYELRSAAMVHANGTKLDGTLKRAFEDLEQDGEAIFAPVQNLYTLDNNVALGLHYIDYSFGPHLVPFTRPGHPYEKATLTSDLWESLNTESPK